MNDSPFTPQPVHWANLFTDDVKLAPYWWDHVPRPTLPAAAPPAQADVVVVGSGYTGLGAALQTARGGRSTVVLDAEDAGWGCSTRNGGQISTSVKPDYAALTAGSAPIVRSASSRRGITRWRGWAEFVAAEGIDCDLRIAGRFHAAHAPSRYEMLARRIASQPKGLQVEAHMVPRAEQRSELGTDAYYGGGGVRAPCRDRSGALPPGPAGSCAGGRRHGDPALRRDGDPARGRRLPRGARRRQHRGAQCRGGDEWIYRRADALAAPARHPDRQLHHRDRASAARRRWTG